MRGGVLVHACHWILAVLQLENAPSHPLLLVLFIYDKLI